MPFASSFLVVVASAAVSICSAHEQQHPFPPPQNGYIRSSPPVIPTTGAAYTLQYRNMFVEAGYAAADVEQRISSILNQLYFTGDPNTQLIHYPAQDPSVNASYVEDIGNQDVRTEGMSYGLMTMVQTNHQGDFDKLYRFWKKYMQHTNPSDNWYGYAAWHVHTDGSPLDDGSACDGETFAVTALLYASSVWGDASGGFNYSLEASVIFEAMLLKETQCNNPTGCNSVGNMFGGFYNDNRPFLVDFTPYASNQDFTDPSYITPAFYTSWAAANPAINFNSKTFWATSVMNASRVFFQQAANPANSLVADYTTFSGQPTGSGDNAQFAYDAWRTARNVAIDAAWLADPSNPSLLKWQTNYCNTLQSFFRNQPKWPSYPNVYTVQGDPQGSNFSPGLASMNAVCSLASDSMIAWDFIDALWNMSTPSGGGRYYDGVLYLEAFLHLSGNYKALAPVLPMP